MKKNSGYAQNWPHYANKEKHPTDLQTIHPIGTPDYANKEKHPTDLQTIHPIGTPDCAWKIPATNVCEMCSSQGSLFNTTSNMKEIGGHVSLFKTFISMEYERLVIFYLFLINLQQSYNISIEYKSQWLIYVLGTHTCCISLSIFLTCS